jgi:GMP synthase (glutamine-hydrolysing)
MSANAPEPYVKAEIDWISVPLSENRPFLGICLGAQMLVKNLGGRVEGHAEGLTEIGWYPIEATEEGRGLIEWPSMVYHFHREGFDLPAGARLLARGQTYENQAIRYGDNAWGIQFHGELTRAMMHRWVVRGAHRFDLPNAQTGDRHLEGRMLHDAPLRNWMSEMLDLVFRRPPSAG